MTDKPILFSAPMVQAILREIRAPGTGKTQTRRVLKPQPRGDVIQFGWVRGTGAHWTDQEWNTHKLPYWTGERLWVRETWSDVWAVRKVPIGEREPAPGAVWYWADGDPTEFEWERPRPSIHMPRWASRITLEVTDVRVQRLQEISEADARAEGVPECLEGSLGDGVYCNRCRGEGVHGALGQGGGVIEVDCSDCDTAIKKFRTLWDSLNADRAPWASNPWVVAVTFRPHLTNIDQMEKAG